MEDGEHGINRRGLFKIILGLSAGAFGNTIDRKTGGVFAKEIKKPPSESWGKLANSELPNDITRSAFFFAGPNNPESPLQNLNPTIEWSDDSVGQIFDDLKTSGVNSVDLSWWGSGDEYKKYSPTLCSPEVVSQVFDACQKRKMLVSPVLEVSDDFQFWKDYPFDTSKLEDRIEFLINNYGNRENWQKMYDRNGNVRHVIKLIETIHGEKIDPTIFAAGFDKVANKIEEKTGKKIGFVIDPTPLPAGGSYEGPDPKALGATESILAINPYNIFSDGETDGERINKAEQILNRWNNSGIPLIASIIPGFDDTHFRSPGQKYGYSDEWYASVSDLARKYHVVGLRIDNWNAVTEGSAVIPTDKTGEGSYKFVKSLLHEKTFNPVAPMHRLFVGGVAQD